MKSRRELIFDERNCYPSRKLSLTALSLKLPTFYGIFGQHVYPTAFVGLLKLSHSTRVFVFNNLDLPKK
jgi:hypothetical protein